MSQSNSKTVLHIVEDSSNDLANSIGVSERRAVDILNHVERTFYDAIMYPYTINRPESVAQILHQISTGCENMQELCFAMYKAGYVYKTYLDKKERQKERKSAKNIFPFMLGDQGDL